MLKYQAVNQAISVLYVIDAVAKLQLGYFLKSGSRGKR